MKDKVFVKKRIWDKKDVDFRMFKEPYNLWILIIYNILFNGNVFQHLLGTIFILAVWSLFFNIPTYKVIYTEKRNKR